MSLVPLEKQPLPIRLCIQYPSYFVKNTPKNIIEKIDLNDLPGSRLFLRTICRELPRRFATLCKPEYYFDNKVYEIDACLHISVKENIYNNDIEFMSSISTALGKEKKCYISISFTYKQGGGHTFLLIKMYNMLYKVESSLNDYEPRVTKLGVCKTNDDIIKLVAISMERYTELDKMWFCIGHIPVDTQIRYNFEYIESQLDSLTLLERGCKLLIEG